MYNKLFYVGFVGVFRQDPPPHGRSAFPSGLLVQPTSWLVAECFYIMAAVYLYPFSYLASNVGDEDAQQQIPSKGSPCCSSSTCLDGLAMYVICFQLEHPVLSSSTGQCAGDFHILPDRNSLFLAGYLMDIACP